MTGKKNAATIIAALTLTLLSAIAPTHARDALFLGLINNRGESVHPEIEQAIRREFAANPNFRLIDELETQRIVREIDRLNRTRAELFVPPNFRLADSTIIIRGFVEELTVTTSRSRLFWGKAEGRMTVKIYFNELSGPASYQGEFSATAQTGSKNLIMFASSKKVTHISAPERLELEGKMRAEIVKKTSEFTTLFFNSLATGSE